MARGPVLERRPALTPLQEAQAHVTAAEEALADAKEALKRARHSERIAQYNKKIAESLWNDEKRRRGFVIPHINRMMTLSTQRLAAAITRRILQESVVKTADGSLNQAQQQLTNLRMESAGNTARETSTLRFGGKDLL